MRLQVYRPQDSQFHVPDQTEIATSGTVPDYSDLAIPEPLSDLVGLYLILGVAIDADLTTLGHIC